jgi:hypothetical protein
MHAPITPIAILMIAICSVPAWAQGQNDSKFWRCGNTYTDQPCASGRAIQADPSPSEEARAAADTQTRRIEKRNDEMESLRVRRDQADAERLRKELNDARNAQLAERRVAATEELTAVRVLQLKRTPHPTSARFKSAAKKKPGQP